MSSGRLAGSAGGPFYVASGLVCAVLLAGIVVLSALVTSSGPRVRGVVAQNLPDGEVAVTDQGITILFDRPIRNRDLEEAVSLTPRVDYELSGANRQLSLLFEENLRYGTEYALAVGPGLADTSGQPMGEGYAYEFTTAEPRFTFLRRDYRGLDQIVERSPLSGEERVIFAADAIEGFARSQTHLAVVRPRGFDAADELVFVDLDSRERTFPDFPGNVKVVSLQASPLGGGFVFVTRVNVGEGADEAYRKGYDGRVYRYDTGSGTLSSVRVPEAGVESATYSRDGQILLLKAIRGQYFVTDASGDSEPALLGGYAATGGFNTESDSILFEGSDGAVVYDAEAQRAETVLPYAEASGARSTPTFLHNSDDLLFTESTFDEAADRGEWQVFTAGVSGGDLERQLVVTEPDYLFDRPVASFDDRYIAVESAVASQPYDSYLGNPQPEGAKIKVWDREKERFVDEVRGIDPAWNR